MSVADSVSVVIPAWNAERYLGEALASVAAQSRPVDEVVVIDDGSTDATSEVAEAAGARVLRQANAGAGVARNEGLAATSGALVAFLDADDVWEPDKIELQVAALDHGADLVFGRARNFASPDRAGELADLRVDTTERAAYIPSALLARRSVFDRVGTFATEGTLTDWVEWYLKTTEVEVPTVVVPRLVVHRRVHGDNATMRDPAARTAYARMLKASLDRRRAAGRRADHETPSQED